MSIIIRDITWYHSDRSLLFEHLDFTIPSGWHVNLAGNNGSGKSTLLNIIAGISVARTGSVSCSTTPYYVPQNYSASGQTVAEALGAAIPLRALQRILDGDTAESNYDQLAEEWDIEERVQKALAYWQLEQLHWDTPMSRLSGGEQTRVLLAGILLHKPSILLLDEPTNHLDRTGRLKLYDFLSAYKGTLLVVSHDRTLLDLNPYTLVLLQGKLEAYGGNYTFYKAQHELQLQALEAGIHEKEKELKVAKKQAQLVKERQQRQLGRDNNAQAKGGMPKIVANTMRNKSELSSAKQNEVHNRQLDHIATELQQRQSALAAAQLLQLRFPDSALHEGKKLVAAIDLNFGYGDSLLWQEPLQFRINSGEHVLLRGANGSGKTTLIRMIMGSLQPSAGILERAECQVLYLDQHYSFVAEEKTVYEQLCAWNRQNLPEHSLKRYLHHYQLGADKWDQKCGQLSGGEKMKLSICCLYVANESPDLIILDEPANNIDLNSQEILIQALKHYKGTLLLVSHDPYLSEALSITQEIDLDRQD